MKTNISLNSLVLLAGFSKRMGQPKQHMHIANRTFLEVILQKLFVLRNYFDSLLFVGQKSDVRSQALVESHNWLWFNNYNPENGPLSSIRIAIRGIEAFGDKPRAFMLWPIDHPLVQINTIKTLIEAFEQNSEKITVPSNGYKRGHPSIFPAWCKKEFFNIPLTEGARQILKLWPDRVNHILTTDPWVQKNINDSKAFSEARLAFFAESSNF